MYGYFSVYSKIISWKYIRGCCSLTVLTSRLNSHLTICKLLLFSDIFTTKRSPQEGSDNASLASHYRTFGPIQVERTAVSKYNLQQLTK